VVAVAFGACWLALLSPDLRSILLRRRQRLAVAVPEV
jgi:hypothetical protein